MNRCFSSMPAVLSAALLQLCASKSEACQTGSGSITNLPPIPGANYQVFGLNDSGQLTGFFYIFGVQPSEAFLYSNGQLNDLGTFGGSTSEGHWINNAGQVVGKADLSGDAQSHAFFFQGSGLVDLGTLGGPNSTANVINDSGVIIGDSDLPGGVGTSGFIYTNGVMTSIGNLGSNYSLAYGLNNSGLVVGEAGLPSGDIHGVTYFNGKLNDVGTLGGSYSAAFAVNDSGLFVGESSVPSSDTHAFVSSGGSLVDLGTFGGTYSSAYLVNSNGLVVGVANTTDDLETHGFVYSSGNLVDMGTLGGSYSLPNAINNLGQIVGQGVDASNDSRAFLWQNGTLTDLNSLLPANSGWVLTTALYINDAGRIVGVGDFGGASEWFILDLGGADTAPAAVAGPDQTVDCQSQVTLDGSHSSGNGPLTYEWSSAGNPLGNSAVLTVALPIGTNVVTLKVTDSCGASAQSNVTVIVADTTPPVGSCPGPVTVSADANCQAVIPDFTSQVVATDNCTPSNSLVISQSPAAGTSVGVGQHPVTITVTDASGNSSGCMVLFTVLTTPPVIQALSVSPSVLSPPNHQLVPVTVCATVAGNCGAAPVTKIVSITCSDIPSPGDIQITGNLTATLAASKASSGNTRVYTLNIQSTDASGNTSTGSVTVTVPKSSGNSGSSGNDVKNCNGKSSIEKNPNEKNGSGKNTKR